MQIVYTSAIQGIAGDEPDAMEENMEPLFKAIMGMPKPVVKEAAPLQVLYLEIHVMHLFCLCMTLDTDVLILTSTVVEIR